MMTRDFSVQTDELSVCLTVYCEINLTGFQYEQIKYLSYIQWKYIKYNKTGSVNYRRKNSSLKPTKRHKG